MDIYIHIADLKVAEITSASGIFSGENRHAQWSAMSKSNTGINLGGSSLCSGSLNLVYASTPGKVNLPGMPDVSRDKNEVMP